MASRSDNVTAAGFEPFSSRGGAPWSANTLQSAIGELPLPPGFLTPEQVAQNAINSPSEAPRTISVDDFLTSPTALVDPKLGSRQFSSAPTSSAVPINVGASVSAFGNAPAPAFLTDAVNRLNQTQSNFRSSEDSFRGKLLDAVLGGNFLAAEALRASAARPGTNIAFGAPVQNPQIGQGFLASSQAAAGESNARTTAVNQQTSQLSTLQNQLRDVERDLKGLGTGGVGGFGGGSIIGNRGGGSGGKAQLQSKQNQIRREIEKQQSVLSSGGAFAPSGFVPRLPNLTTIR
jgi:hypothetical protein